ncbi:MAG TPA: hypothetical protein VFW95_00560 [Candidatus Limnocylindria bacterium]|nr:hypothetical protein [Candidatus Limnocylindria bacterium]
MSGRSVAVTVTLVAVTMATLLLVVSDGTGVLRVGLGLGVALLVPGLAALRLLRLATDLISTIGLAVALSTTIDIAIVLPMFYLRVWSIELAVTMLTFVILALVALGIPFVRQGIGRHARGAIGALSRWGPT